MLFISIILFVAAAMYLNSPGEAEEFTSQPCPVSEAEVLAILAAADATPTPSDS